MIGTKIIKKQLSIERKYDIFEPYGRTRTNKYYPDGTIEDYFE